MEFKPLNEVRCETGEGPTWDDRGQALFQVDIPARTIYRFDAASGATQKWVFPSEVGSIGLAESGRLVVAVRHTVGLFDTVDGKWTELAQIEPERVRTTRTNDGKVGPDGAFWVGTMDDRDDIPAKEPIASLYRVTADGKVEKKIDGGVIISNGLAWSPDGKTMYHTDARAGWIDRWAFDPATGNIGKRTRIATMDNESGRPDGGATDADGNYWSAGVSAHCLNKFAPDGKLLDKIEVPVAAPTMPCFGGKDLRTLYVTSLRTGRAPEALARYPLTGVTVFGRAPVAGAPVVRFRDR